jgi:hypothetical protein
MARAILDPSCPDAIFPAVELLSPWAFCFIPPHPEWQLLHTTARLLRNMVVILASYLSGGDTIMKHIPVLILGLSLVFASAAVTSAQETVKEETKVKEKHGKCKETTKATTSDTLTGNQSSEKTKVKSKHGKTKVTTETKGN